MTLILTVGNTSGIHQSSDYQLTDRDSGKFISDTAGSKQLQAGFNNLELRLAFTGVATIASGQRTIDWLAQELRALPLESDLQAICESLKKRCESIASSPRHLLELVLTASELEKPFRVAVISNIDWGQMPPTAKSQFEIRMIREILGPFELISGYHPCVYAPERNRLLGLAREHAKPSTYYMETLKEINAVSATHSDGRVSGGCWATSLTIDGKLRRSASANFGEKPGEIRLTHGGVDLEEFIRKNFRIDPDQRLTVKQTASVIVPQGGGTPIPPPFGDPRKFVLSFPRGAGSLKLPTGEDCAVLEIAPIDPVIELRCSEEAIMPWATISLHRVGPIGPAFPRPLLPWPKLPTRLLLDGIPVVEEWGFEIGHWIEDKILKVVIPHSCRSIVNTGFLGSSEKLVVCAPAKTIEIPLTAAVGSVSLPLEARIFRQLKSDGD